MVSSLATSLLLLLLLGGGSRHPTPAHLCPAPCPAAPHSRAILHNLRYDDTLLTLHNAAGAGTNADRFLTGSDAQAAALAAPAAVTTLAFRTGE